MVENLPAIQMESARALEGNVRFFRICETESGRTAEGVCAILSKREGYLFGFRVLQKSFVIKVKVEHS